MSIEKLLIVVDYQNDFVKGSLGFKQAEQIEIPICNKIKEYKARGYDVAFTFDTHTKNYLNTQEGKNLPIEHCIEGSNGWQLYGAVSDLCEESDMKFNKCTFGSLELAECLKTKYYERIEFVGVVTNICIISNAILAKSALPEAVIIVDAKCTASSDNDMNNKALDVMESLQMKVINR